jgi:fluoride ion exporter CrcB/FEX
MERHEYGLAAAYVAVSVVVSLAALFAGLAVFQSESFIP